MPIITNPYPNLFQPLQVGSQRVKNRFQYAPMVSAHATALEGDVTPELVEFVGAQARTGAGLVTIGSSPVDFDRSRDFYGAVAVSRETDIPGLQRLAAEAHRYGAKISIELCHGGLIAHPGTLHGKPAFAPSKLPGMENIKEISKEEIKQVIENFVTATLNVRRAGFDMVMIHGAHGGNLISSFLSPIYNHRTDAYGGSLENRMRFPLELLKAVRDAVGNTMSIEYRISGYEHNEGCNPIEDTCAFLKKAQQYIDLVNVSGGALTNLSTMQYCLPSYHMPHLLNVKYAKAIKDSIDIPVSVVGNITSIEEADKIIASGQADMVSMARNLIADFEFISKARRDEVSEIRPCLRCYHCCDGPNIGNHVSCAVNPQAGRETKYRSIPPAPIKKRVMIVGGGTAGMEAARVAVKRGHDVTLYEAQEKLGGRLYEASAMYCKDGFRAYTGWSIDHTQSSGAKIVLGTKVTLDLIIEEDPDALIIAVGAENHRPGIKGINGANVVDVSSVDRHEVEVGQKVVICGAGLSGAECAVDLARGGKEVSLIDFQSKQQLFETNVIVRASLNELLEKNKVAVIYEACINEIREDGVAYTDKDGNEKFVNADTVISALGLKINQDAIDKINMLVAETYVVGDAAEVGTVATANRQAFDVAVEL